MGISKRQRGMGLIELMIAMFILAVGLIGVLGVILAAMTSNNRNKSDTGATFVAQLVIEQIGAAGNASSVTLTDCAGTAHTITLATAVSPGDGATLYTTSTAPTSSLVNTIDWTQDASTVTSGYQMYWVMCDANGIHQTFDVRWNMTDLSAVMSAQTKLVTVGARPRAASTSEIRRFAMPATLRLVSTN
jgi:type IV pilus modification protein PilV